MTRHGLAGLLAQPPFVVAGASHAAAALIAGGLAAYGLAGFGVAWKGFRDRLVDRWSTLACSVALLACGWAMLQWGAEMVPAPFGTLAVVALALGLVCAVLFVALRMQEGLDLVRAYAERMWKVPTPDLPHEERRKLPHLAMGIFALILLGLGHATLVLVTAPAPPGAVSPGEGWGNVVAARDASWHDGGIAVALTMLLSLVLVLAPVELLRLAFPQVAYPWKRIIEPLLRPREAGLLGGHLHMAVGVTLAALILARNPQWADLAAALLAVILVAVFADAASAIIGIRFGRKKWPHNSNKSYAGTIGGTAAALLLAVPVVGFPLGFATAAWFLIVDVGAPVPVPISDNLLNPIGLAVMYAAVPAWVAPLIRLP